MKVDPRAIEAIRTKVERAHDHFVFLDQEVRRFQDREPYQFVHEIRADGAQHLFRLKLEEPVPPMWSVVLGETIHNLRSALDQAVYWLTIDNMGTEFSKTGFPVFTRRLRLGKESGFAEISRKYPEGIPGSGLYMIRGVGSGPATFIERLQPYPQRRGPLPKSLLALHEFWNQDKHRLVHLWGFVITGNTQMRISGTGPFSECLPKPASGVFDDGAVAVRVTCNPPNPDVEIHGKTHIDVAVKHPSKHRRRAQVTLMDMFWDIAGVVARLLNALGRQDELVRHGAIPESEWGWPVKP
ncbi:MAG: hypothetical protein O7C01_00190 [Actinobacteria bacterium]|nr:hypothetical protein [Actinomycetota bacterium]